MKLNGMGKEGSGVDNQEVIETLRWGGGVLRGSGLVNSQGEWRTEGMDAWHGGGFIGGEKARGR